MKKKMKQVLLNKNGLGCRRKCADDMTVFRKFVMQLNIFRMRVDKPVTLEPSTKFSWEFYPEKFSPIEKLPKYHKLFKN